MPKVQEGHLEGHLPPCTRHRWNWWQTGRNPLLGWSGIRACLDQPPLFRTQLRALMRAAVHGDLRVPLPFVVSADEIRATRALLDVAAGEPAARRAVFRREVPIGVVIETPAAALGGDALTEGISCFCIGMNDLSQYRRSR